MKNFKQKPFKSYIFIVGVFLLGVLLITKGNIIGNGIKTGLDIIFNNLVPSLFPFMIFASFISNRGFILKNGGFTERITTAIFRCNKYAIFPFVLGILGGYPVGATTINDLKNKKLLTQKDSENLFYWCINPSPAFVITAVGTFMLNNTLSGVILYVSCVLSSLTIGFFCRFLNENKSDFSEALTEKIPNSQNLIHAVSQASNSILGLCGWVLLFSGVCAATDFLVKNNTCRLFLRIICEVTSGCKTASCARIPLPVIAAIISFGGLAVICQVSAYAIQSGVQLKRLFCSRLIGAAISALYCNAITKILPQSIHSSVSLTIGNASFSLYHSYLATILLLLMLVVLILEVDNHKKIC
jgi:sporulation integral membrane protein YlbJ